MKRVLLPIIVFFCSYCCFSQDFDDKYYGKHIIIAIDQTPDVQTHEDIDIIKDWVRNLLLNIPIDKSSLDIQSDDYVDFNFDERRDRISLFAFGIEGAGGHLANYESPYMSIKRSQMSSDLNVKKVINEFTEALISPRKSYDSYDNSLKVDDYIENEIMPMLSRQDRKAIAISQISGVTLSYYVFPTILNMIDVSVPAEKYYLIMITNFKSGSAGGINTDDENKLGELLTNINCRNAFNKMRSELNNEYKETKIGSLLPKARGNAAKRPQIIIYRLKHRAFIDSSENADIESNIDIHQQEWNSQLFNMDPVMIKLADTSIRAIVMDIKDEYGNLIQHKSFASSAKECKSLYTNKKYTLPSLELSLPKLKKKGDILDFSYVFYPEAISGDRLPMVYTASRRVGVSENNFVPEPDAITSTSKWYLWVFYGIIIASLIAGLLWLRKMRGERRKVNVNFDILPISNTRYMNVEGNKVVNLDCWYMEIGKIGKDIRNITVEGRMVLENIGWAKKCNYRLEYLIEDCDTDDMFTFRPEGGLSSGANKKANEWYEVYLEQDNTFRFRVQSFMDKIKHPELNDATKVAEMLDAENHIHELKVMFRVRLLKEELKDRVTLSEDEVRNHVIKTIDADKEGKRYEKHYSYIVKPYYQKSDAWVSFDPGTTGSCVALGSSGLPIDTDNIHVALNKEGHAGDSENTYNPIFPSKIRITDRSRIFKESGDCVDETGQVVHVENLEEGADRDFTFGNDADNRLGNNIFQSIKKLLGFQTAMKVHDNKKGCDYQISGKDLAHLIVKGLYNRVEEYIMTDPLVNNNFRQFYLDDFGRFSPQRAIVAVPNNYTISKVQEMVDTVKRLGKFREVHYLYESEAVLMTYCRKEYANLPHLEDSIVVVYDMGGATINATAFSLNVRMRGAEIDQISAETISKIGYCFGGDDIDYYIIRSLYGTKAIRNLFFTEDDMKNHMLQHKQQLIKLATKIKIDKVAEFQRNRREFATSEELLNEVAVQFAKMGKSIALESVDSQNFSNEFNDELKKNLKEFVYPLVRDAVKELVISLGQSHKSKNVVLVFSGRSSAFPGVKSNVVHVIKEQFNEYECWDGFNDQDGNLDVDKVKTAVAIGGNWYALFSKLIRLEHNLVPTTIGFIDLRNSGRTFVSIIEKNQKFENGLINGKQCPSEVLSEVEFVQMQGSDYEKILSDYYGDNASRNRHKLNKLELVRKSVIDGKIIEIRATLDDKNNFDYEIMSSNTITKENNPYSMLTGSNDIKLEVADENNESYIYALSQYDGGANVGVLPENNVNVTTNLIKPKRL